MSLTSGLQQTASNTRKYKNRWNLIKLLFFLVLVGGFYLLKWLGVLN